MNEFVSSPTEVVKVGEPLPNSDEINKALEKGELYKQGFKEGYKQAIIDGKTNFSRLQGKWITRTEDNGINYRFYCSCCDREVMLITEYCPYCGADNMKKGGAK